jgi:hypothetical protein
VLTKEQGAELRKILRANRPRLKPFYDALEKARAERLKREAMTTCSTKS